MLHTSKTEASKVVVFYKTLCKIIHGYTNSFVLCYNRVIILICIYIGDKMHLYSNFLKAIRA